MGLGKSPRTISLVWLNWIVTIAVVLGIFFRFYHLGYKTYWFDETMTSLRVSGWNQASLVTSAYNGQPITVDRFLEIYQYPNPATPWRQTIEVLASHPEHSPLYYLGLRLWLQIVPHSIADVRLFSALIGLLVLPLTYYLARHLFDEPRVAQVALGLVALSPFHIHYAQEAREYSLWTVAILAASLALWRSCHPPAHHTSRSRRGSPPLLSKWWLIYGVSVALLLYSQPFSAFVLAAHGFYVLYLGFKSGQFKRLRAFLLASSLGLLLFLPWLWLALQNIHEFFENTNHTTQSLDTSIVLYWLRNLSFIFLDVNQGTSPLNPLVYLFLWFTGYSLWFVWLRGRPQTALFILFLTGTIALSLMLPDILLGGRRSHSMRYFVPSILGVQLSVAYLLSCKFNLRQLTSQQLRRWRNGTVLLFCSSLLSLMISSQHQNWWTKSNSKSGYHPQIAQLVNMAATEKTRRVAVNDPPLLPITRSTVIVTDESSGQILSLAHLLNPQIDLILAVPGTTPTIPAKYQRVFIYRSSETFQTQIAQQLQGQLAERSKWLSEVIRSS